VALGLIADGVHVSATMAVLLQRLAGDRLVLVSDALAPYGLSEGRHRWDDRVLLVQNGSCRLEDGTLAGVTLPLLEGVRRLARWGGECEGAIWAATLAPRDVIAGPDADVGGWRSLLLHQPLANLLRWSIGPDGDLHWRHAA
jgi:N-acetylglucosamine-6-phosphate deacetylase